MKSLKEFNEDRLAQIEEEQNPRLRFNGIQCPNCEGELHDPAPNEVLLSNPPKKVVRCSLCGFQGYRIA